MKKKQYVILGLLPLFYLFIIRNLLFNASSKPRLRFTAPNLSIQDILTICDAISDHHPFRQDIFIKHNPDATYGHCQNIYEAKQKGKALCLSSDYDGSRSSQQVRLKLSDEVIEKYHLNRTLFPSQVYENRNAFLYFIALFEAAGFNSRMLLGGNTPSERANNLAAKIKQCIQKDWHSKHFKHQINYSWCVNEEMAGLKRHQELNLLLFFFDLFPALQKQYDFALLSQAFYVEQNMTVMAQTGSPDAIVIAQAFYQHDAASRLLTTPACYNGLNSCPLISDSVMLDQNQRLTLTADTAKVCHNTRFSENPTDECIDHGIGKLSGKHRIESEHQFQCEHIDVVHVNSDNDYWLAAAVANQSHAFAPVFSNDNPALCESINRYYPGKCVNVQNSEHERFVTMDVTLETMALMSKMATSAVAPKERGYAKREVIQLPNLGISYCNGSGLTFFADKQGGCFVSEDAKNDEQQKSARHLGNLFEHII